MKSITFGKKQVLQIVSNDIKNDIKQKIKDICNMEITTRYYNFLNEKNLHILNNDDYKVCINTFGHKYLLFVTKYKNKNYSIFINKKRGDMIYIRFRFDEEIFNSTLFDGELIKNNEDNWVYVISDIISYNNEFVLKTKTLDERLELLDNIYNNKYVKDEIMNYCKIDIKKYFKLKYLSDIKERYIDSIPYKCSGLYFQNISEYKKGFMYIFPEFRSNDNNNNNNNKNNNNNNNTRSANIKNKIVNNNQNYNIISSTLNTSNITPLNANEPNKKQLYNFKIEKTDLPDIYKLYYDNNGEIKYLDYAGVSNIETSKLLSETFEKMGEDVDVVMTCEYLDNFNKWIPKKITNDKIGCVIKNI